MVMAWYSYHILKVGVGLQPAAAVGHTMGESQVL